MGKDKQDIYTVLQALQSLAALTDPECVQTAALALRITQRLPVVTSISYPWSSVHSVELACRAEEFAESGRLRGLHQKALWISSAVRRKPHNTLPKLPRCRRRNSPDWL